MKKKMMKKKIVKRKDIDEMKRVNKEEDSKKSYCYRISNKV